MVTVKTIGKSFDHDPRCPSVLWLPECKARVKAKAIAEIQLRVSDRYVVKTVTHFEPATGEVNEDLALVRQYEMTLSELVQWLEESGTRDPPEEVVQIDKLTQDCNQHETRWTYEPQEDNHKPS
jgi:hypothetical protein